MVTRVSESSLSSYVMLLEFSGSEGWEKKRKERASEDATVVRKRKRITTCSAPPLNTTLYREFSALDHPYYVR